MHEIVDGESIEEAEAGPWEKWQEGEEVPELSVLFSLLAVVENGREVKFPLV